jgi:hypothetical protein
VSKKDDIIEASLLLRISTPFGPPGGDEATPFHQNLPSFTREPMAHGDTIRWVVERTAEPGGTMVFCCRVLAFSNFAELTEKTTPEKSTCASAIVY